MIYYIQIPRSVDYSILIRWSREMFAVCAARRMQYIMLPGPIKVNNIIFMNKS